MIDPYRLFIEAPDHLRFMLTQATFDQVRCADRLMQP